MNIIIPLGGKGERFLKEGYTQPKPFIRVFHKEILFHTIDNLSILPHVDKVFIIYNKDLDLFHFQEKIREKYPFISLIRLDSDTKGASETIFIGLKYILENHLTNHSKTLLVDGDAFYLTDIVSLFRQRPKNENCVFFTKNTDPQPVFSYISINPETNAITMIREKEKISDNANTGAYAFSNIKQLYECAEFVVNSNITFRNECYISCIIDEMIKAKTSPFFGIELPERSVVVLGTPRQVQEYEARTCIFLFDLDGTLVRTDDIYVNVWTEILKDYNIFLTSDIFQSIIQGHNDGYVFKKLLPNIDVDINNVSQLKDELFLKNLQKIEVIEGAHTFLNNIKNAGHPIAIVTNCNRKVAQSMLEYTKLIDFVDVIICGNDCNRPKPFPDPYLKACQYFNVQNASRKAIIFEDSKAGILSARSIQPKCLVGIETIYNDYELKSLGVHLSVPNYNSLSCDSLLHFQEDITESLKSSIISSIPLHITDVEIFDEKIKGGYISDVIRVILKLDNGDVKHCILKMENPLETKLSKMAQKLGLYEREYYFYENISKYVNIAIPSFYGLVKDSNMKNIGILLENLNTKNTFLNLNLNQESIDVSLAIVESAAKMHAKFWNKDLQNVFPELMKNNHPRFNPTWSQYIQESWPLFQQKWSDFLNETQLHLANQIVRNFSNIQEELSESNLTLCHGDIKSPNIFYRKEGNAYTPYFIDWQYISHGKGVQDIVFLMIESYDIEKSEQFVPLLKNYYFVKLRENGVTDYSYDSFERDFVNSICYYPFFVAIWFGTTPEEDLIDKNFPFFFIQKLFHFIYKFVPHSRFLL